MTDEIGFGILDEAALLICRDCRLDAFSDGQLKNLQASDTGELSADFDRLLHVKVSDDGGADARLGHYENAIAPIICRRRN